MTGCAELTHEPLEERRAGARFLAGWQRDREARPAVALAIGQLGLGELQPVVGAPVLLAVLTDSARARRHQRTLTRPTFDPKRAAARWGSRSASLIGFAR